MTNSIFITGTDTDAGKTLVTCALLHQLNHNKLPSIAIKPIATGYNIDNPEPNSDLAQLHQTMTKKIPIKSMQYFSSTTPCAPNLCPESKNNPLEANKIIEFCQTTIDNNQGSTTLIEGIGGWMCPINQKETMADIAIKLNCQIILVVGLKLGCLNHCLLTYEQIKSSKANLIGWVANNIDPDLDLSQTQDNINFLKQKISAPCLGAIPFLPANTRTAQKAGSFLSTNISPATTINTSLAT